MEKPLSERALVRFRFRNRLGDRNWNDARWLRELRSGNPVATVSDPDWPPAYRLPRVYRRLRQLTCPPGVATVRAGSGSMR